jgi:hypothetical protein
MINYTFDSEDEKLFYNWLEELAALDLIEVKPDKVSFDLNESLSRCATVKSKNKKEEFTETTLNLIKVKHYTPDFIFRFKQDGFSMKLSLEHCQFAITPLLTSSDGWCYVDVKGSFTRNLSSSITFPDRQVMLYQKHGIYVNKVICHNPKDTDKKGNCLFKATFVPLVFIENSLRKRVGKNGEQIGESKIKYKINTIQEWIAKKRIS